MIFRFLVLVFSQTHLSIPESQSKKAVQRDFRLPVFSSSHISNLPGPLKSEQQSGVIYHFAADKVYFHYLNYKKSAKFAGHAHPSFHFPKITGTLKITIFS